MLDVTCFYRCCLKSKLRQIESESKLFDAMHSAFGFRYGLPVNDNEDFFFYEQGDVSSIK